MKLHLGCGRKYLEGYINIDAKSEFSEIKADLYHDNLKDIPGVEPHSVDEILLVHVIEHLYPYDVQDHLDYWHYLLKKGGRLVIEAPDIEKLVGLWGKIDTARLLRWIYGHTPSKCPHDLHKTGCSATLLMPMLQKAGFSSIQEEPPKFHGQKAWRDFRVVSTK